ncbi:MAG: hypothetical protein U9R25_15175, partial [Chloroflexota bacterium]|nr:hypothetical protein [Chloroflexota bacterium]
VFWKLTAVCGLSSAVFWKLTAVCGLSSAVFWKLTAVCGLPSAVFWKRFRQWQYSSRKAESIENPH